MTKLLLLVPLLALPLACVAPMMRTSNIRRGLSHEGGIGLIGMMSSIRQDPTPPESVPPPIEGLQAGYRVGFGFGDEVAIELTLLASLAGYHPVWDGAFASGIVEVAAKFHPWTTNNLVVIEANSQNEYTAGWVGGFPHRGEEKWSIMAMVGGTGFASYGGTEHVTLGIVKLGIARNFTCGKVRLSPAFTSMLEKDMASEWGAWRGQLGLVIGPRPPMMRR